jgi:hypothetical protein
MAIMTGNKDNVIFNDMDESIGYYKDLYAVFVSVIEQALKDGDPETAQEQTEYLKDMECYKDYNGLLVLSMNNGMGFTCEPYRDDWEVAKWVAENIAPEDDDAMPKIYGDQDRQAEFMKQVKQFMKEE